MSCDIKVAQQEAEGFVLQSNRAACALRSLAAVLGDEDRPLDPGHSAGLLEAVVLVGEGLEAYATDRCALLEGIEEKRHQSTKETPV